MTYSVDSGWRLPDRRHIEAFPALSIAAAFRELRRGIAGAVVWRNRFGHAVGTARVSSDNAAHLNIESDMLDLPYDTASNVEIDVSIIRDGSTADNAQPYAICPECGRKIANIILKSGRWECHKCHRLSHRTAIVSKNVRLAEKRDCLIAEIGSGRPKHMRHAAYQSKCAELAEITAEIGSATYTAAAEHLDRVTAEWVRTIPAHANFMIRTKN